MALAFDASAAYTFGVCVEAAYRLFKAGVLDPATTAVPLPPGWQVETRLNAIDRVGLKSEPEFFGLVLQSIANPTSSSPSAALEPRLCRVAESVCRAEADAVSSCRGWGLSTASGRAARRARGSLR